MNFLFMTQIKGKPNALFNFMGNTCKSETDNKNKFKLPVKNGKKTGGIKQKTKKK